MIQVLLETSLTEQRTKIVSAGSLLLLKWSFRQAFNYLGKECWALIVFPLYTVSLCFLRWVLPPGTCCPRWVLHSCCDHHRITEWRLLGTGTDCPSNHPCSNHIFFHLASSSMFYKVSQLFNLEDFQYLSYISCRVLIQDWHLKKMRLMMLFHDSLFTVLAVKRAHLGGLDR